MWPGQQSHNNKVKERRKRERFNQFLDGMQNRCWRSERFILTSTLCACDIKLLVDSQEDLCSDSPTYDVTTSADDDHEEAEEEEEFPNLSTSRAGKHRRPVD